jgi:menaquinone-dependent protoporphyrinogen oxidase
MVDKILIAYVSKAGSTGEVAEVIGQVLREAGAVVDVYPVKDVQDLSPYRSAIIGSAVRMGKLLPDAVRFAQEHQEELKRMTAAYFLVCATMKEDTPEHREQVAAYLHPLCDIRPPADVGLFAGKVDPEKMAIFWRLMCGLSKDGVMTPGDFRDWEAIRAWARNLAPALIGEAS